MKLYQDVFNKAAEEIGKRFAQDGVKTFIKMEKIVMNGIDSGNDDADVEHICSAYCSYQQKMVSNISTLKYSGKTFKSFNLVINYIKGLTSEG